MPNSQVMENENIEILRKKISTLNNICNTLNPYDPISDPMKEELAQFNISDQDDPFAITNKLVMLLENSVENLTKLISEEQTH